MQDFIDAQRVRAQRPTDEGGRRDYLLAGVVMCGVCGRRMDAHWVHGRPGYRCRHGYGSARPRPDDGPKPLYWREDSLMKHIADATAPPQPDSIVTATASSAELHEQHVVVLCWRDAVELHRKSS
ncbi:zinc ribbon domain-containing protein [Saccharothrix variisporea]|uniref:zinc ribbon domain-containing protein n=1 Tax=Saccharothrix variisporea TaxID=543527 RepID=UPI001FE46A2E|nr:zinc ribbon domain-containing protein [Saccharothrix variisporea]